MAQGEGSWSAGRWPLSLSSRMLIPAAAAPCTAAKAAGGALALDAPAVAEDAAGCAAGVLRCAEWWMPAARGSGCVMRGVIGWRGLEALLGKP